MTGFVDIHHHVLPGLDDGPETERDAEAMIGAAQENGIAALVATPHMYPGRSPFDTDKYSAAVQWAQRYCATNYTQLRILPGAEVYYTESTPRYLAERRIPTLAGTRYVLIEFDPVVQYRFVKQATEQVLSAGYWPVIAHVERYLDLLKHPSQIAALRSIGEVRFQMNAQSLMCSPLLSFACHRLLRAHLIDYIATDAHNTKSRRVILGDCAAKLGPKYGEYAQQLLVDNPRALIESRPFQ